MINRHSNFSLRSGNWFVSPLFVWGSESLDSKVLQLHFDRSLYDDLYILIQDEHKKTFLSAQIQSSIKEFSFEMSDWPKGKYSLMLKDQEKFNTYQIMKD